MSSFRFGLGHVALDLVATVADRPGRHVERLIEPTDLDRWLLEAGLVDAGPAQPPATRRQLTEARKLREAVYGILTAARAASAPEEADVSTLNTFARRQIAAPQVGSSLTLTKVSNNPVATALAEIARASVELVTGPELSRLRQCLGCSLLFIDRSRPGRRRWCSMDRCGNRSKTARYRAARA